MDHHNNNNEILSIIQYNTDTGNRDLGTEITISKDTCFSDILKTAIQLNAYLIVKSSYVSESKPGKYYIKGYTDQKTYLEIKELLDKNILDNKFTKRKSWLIKYDDTKKIYKKDDLHKENFTHSKILKCKIWKNNKIITEKNTYRRILIDIWKHMPLQKILKNTSFKIKLTNSNNNIQGYNYVPSLKFLFQNKNSNGTFNEICNLIELNKYNIYIEIKLNNNKYIKYEC